MRAVDVIARKRDGNELSAEEISWFIQGVVNRSIADYQAAAWLMAIYLRGMTSSETAQLTTAMAESGGHLDLGKLASRAVDKHSTGGVGDKVSLVVGPIAAAAGVVVAKMSGRGLGSTGGTLDKLESIPGFSVELSNKRIIAQASEIGLVIAGQTLSLAPADGILYPLRDVTATVECLPLIVSSILSKKLAGGAPSIVFDVKVGNGAFMKTEQTARELAQSLVDVGNAAGRRVVAYLTRMDQPLGFAVGNALEVREAIEVLQGRGPTDVRELALTLASDMIALAGLTPLGESSLELARTQLETGAALVKFSHMIGAQGGDPNVTSDLRLIGVSPHMYVARSEKSGWISGLDAGAIGQAVVHMGAGRTRKTDRIDHGVGIIFAKKIGDRVSTGDELFRLYVSNPAEADESCAAIHRAYSWADQKLDVPPVIVGRIDGS